MNLKWVVLINIIFLAFSQAQSNPCSSRKAKKGDPFPIGLAYYPGGTVDQWGTFGETAGKVQTDYSGLHPCNNNQTQKMKNERIGMSVFTVKVDELTFLETSAEAEQAMLQVSTDKKGYKEVLSAVAFAAPHRSPPVYIRSNDGDLTGDKGVGEAFAVVLELDEGVLKGMEWMGLGCKMGVSNRNCSGCITTNYDSYDIDSCAAPLDKCQEDTLESEKDEVCRTKIFVTFTGTDVDGRALTSGNDIKQIKKLSLKELFGRVRKGISNAVDDIKGKTTTDSGTKAKDGEDSLESSTIAEQSDKQATDRSAPKPPQSSKKDQSQDQANNQEQTDQQGAPPTQGTKIKESLTDPKPQSPQEGNTPDGDKSKNETPEEEGSGGEGSDGDGSEPKEKEPTEEPPPPEEPKESTPPPEPKPEPTPEATAPVAEPPAGEVALVELPAPEDLPVVLVDVAEPEVEPLCRIRDNGICTACNTPGSFLWEEECYVCNEECSGNCQDGQGCVQCKDGHHRTGNGLKACRPCSQGCITCNTGGSCTQCSPGTYQFANEDDLTVCVGCPEGCATCQPNDQEDDPRPSCTKCNEGSGRYLFRAGGEKEPSQCLPCPDSCKPCIDFQQQYDEATCLATQAS